VENIVAEMKEMYFRYGVRIFNFQDDNFYLPAQDKAIDRFRALHEGLKREKVEGIAIAIKARPESIDRESVEILDKLGLFRVFLGVENASAHGLEDLNRRQTIDQTLNALTVLNDFDIHVAYNFLMFEPNTVMDDILVNIRFMERHLDNPFNFCRAEAYAGTGLEAQLRSEGRLLGSYFGFDYRLKDPKSELFHKIANYAFFDRNFSDYGLHYFNMQVDFYYQLLRRFYPELLSETLRSHVRRFIKETNLDTHRWLCEIYDFISAGNSDSEAVRRISEEIRAKVNWRSEELRSQGEAIIDWMENAHKIFANSGEVPRFSVPSLSTVHSSASPSYGVNENSFVPQTFGSSATMDLFGISSNAIPYNFFKKKLNEETGR
jgi:hypothetical protein